MPLKPPDDRAAFQYSDAVMTFASIVAIAVISPWLYAAIDKLQNVVDPMTAVILGAVPALLVIALILSVGVSARS